MVKLFSTWFMRAFACFFSWCWVAESVFQMGWSMELVEVRGVEARECGEMMLSVLQRKLLSEHDDGSSSWPKSINDSLRS